MKISRRNFLSYSVGAGALAAAGPAFDSFRKLYPYITPPERIKPGKWTLYATTCRECPAGCGLHARVVDARPINVAGNPAHPVNHGGLCARGQSCVMGLYDPDRLTGPLKDGKPTTWDAATSAVSSRLRESKGRVIVLSGIETGAPAGVIGKFAAAFGADRPLFYEPFNAETVASANQRIFGRRDIPRYRLDDCDFIISFGADFLETWISPVEFARGFTAARSLDRERPARFVYVGSRLSMTAANADEFIMVPPGGERLVAAAMLREGDAPLPAGVSREMLARLRKEFQQSKSPVALGAQLGKEADFSQTHALGRTTPIDNVRKALESIGPDDIVIVHNSNPAFTMPAVVPALKRAGMVVYLGTMPDETAALAQFVLPIDSPLESWGDYEPWTGVHGLMQPAITRLYDTRPAGDVLLALAAASGRALVPEGASKSPATFEEWLSHDWEMLRRRVAPDAPWEEFWRNALRSGGVFETPPPVKIEQQIVVDPEPAIPASPAKPGELALVTWPSVMLYDGRTANRGWLQEAPDPTTTVVWGSFADIHPKTAAMLGVKGDDLLRIARGESAVEIPARVTEDVAEGAVAMAFGQGHTSFGRNATGCGANAFLLVEPGSSSASVVVAKAGRTRAITTSCTTQDQHHREILQWATLADVRAGRIPVPQTYTMPLPSGYDPKVDVFPGHKYDEHRWVMAVDLAKCTGCGACAVACQAENNIPVVGETQVKRYQFMAWLRIVPYRLEEKGTVPPTASGGQSPSPHIAFLPIMCQQCDSAPCEPVCPVFASVHNDEGINSQVYNRCIGTRYCSNNCPYKVRRFNWQNFEWPKPLAMQLNPEVTVRERGVMEKCTFCIQRIRGAEIAAKRENRAVRDGEIVPACVQSCPTQAFIFGDLMNKKSRVFEVTNNDPRRYHVLEELRTKPAVAYLKRVIVDREA